MQRQRIKSLCDNTCPYTGKLDDLSEQPVKEIINKVLKNDAKKAFDIAAHAQFNVTALRVVPASSGTSTTALTLTTNGTCTGTNNIALGKAHIKLISDLMKERNIPPYQGDDYFAIAWPTTYRTFKDDIESLHTYVDKGFQMIMAGEIGRFEGMRFIEQTNVAKDTFVNAKSNWCFFFGDDTVAEAIAVPEEMRGKIPSDYGRSRGIAWYYLGGFGLVHPVNSGNNSKNARIVKWDSVG